MSGLIKYEAARTALAECKAVDEVKQWADKAAAMQAYGRMAKDKTLEIDAAEIRIRAERRLGEMLSVQKDSDGLNTGGRPSKKPLVSDEEFSKPSLKDAGISYDLSSRAQKLAAVPEQEFEKEVGDWRERVEKEGKRVSARLQKAGEKAIKNHEKESADEETYGDFDPIEELESAHKEIERLQKIIECNDHLTEIKRLSDLLHVTESQRDGFQASVSDLKRQVKYWKSKLEKLEKQVNKADLVDF